MITKEKIKTYERIRSSGVTNMFDLRKVIFLSKGKLTKVDCFEIMQNYSDFMKKFKIKRR